MEAFLIKALQLILALAILVSIHEFGHYIFARMFGMRVDRFYLFFNPWFSLLKYAPDKGKLQLIAWTSQPKGADGKPDKDAKEEEHALISFSVRKHASFKKNGKPSWASTLYGIGWLPLGGYCSIAGMIDETNDGKNLSKEPEAWEFRAKKPFPRLMVMLAGVIFNFLLAIVIYIGIAWHWGERVIPYDKATEGMDFTEQMHEIGLRDGDRILAVNGKSADATNSRQMWDMLQDGSVITVARKTAAALDTADIKVPDGFLAKIADQKTPLMGYRYPVVVLKPVNGEPAMKAGIQAGDRIVAVAGKPTPSLTEFFPTLKDGAGHKVPVTIERDGKELTMDVDINSDGKIGIQLETDPNNLFEVLEVDYTLWQAIPKGITDGIDNLVNYVSSLKLLFTKTGAQSVGGFGAIGDMFPEQWNWYKFWNLTAFLSVILAFMNILPIPALDGGHATFTLWEIITRRKPSEKVLEYAQMVGMAILFLLLIYANLNDIYRFFIK